MDTFLRFGFLWISVGILFSQERSEACSGRSLPDACEFIFRNTCFEFVWESATWSQADNSCETRGGELLKVTTNPLKIILKNISSDRNISRFTWWLGEQVQGTAVGEYHRKTVSFTSIPFIVKMFHLINIVNLYLYMCISHFAIKLVSLDYLNLLYNCKKVVLFYVQSKLRRPAAPTWS